MVRLKAVLLVAMLVGTTFGVKALPMQVESSDEPVGLISLFSTGLIFQDRNDDQVIDFVNASLILGAQPSDSDIVAASDVAARLGFETMAMDIPVLGSPDEGDVGILIGMAALSRVGLSSADAGVANLEPGEGVVKTIFSENRQWIVIAGADDAGTRAAAGTFAGRLPNVWSPGGTNLGDVIEELSTYLEDQGASLETARVPSVQVKSGSKGLDVLTVESTFGSATALSTARSALEELSEARDGGGSGDGALLSYDGASVLRVVLSAPGSDTVAVDVRHVAPTPEDGPIPGRPGSGAKEDLDLSNLYSSSGFLGDSDDNVIPDRVDVILSPSGDGSQSTVHLAARLGLESAGITLPIATTAEEIEDPGSEPTLVLIGTSHPLVDKLVEDTKLQLPTLDAGQGLIQVVTEAFNGKSAVVLTGGDEQGTARALQQVAERFPNVWERGKDRTTIDDVENDLWRFFSGRSSAGQATIALYKLDKLVEKLSGKDIETAKILVSLEDPDEGFEELIRQRAAAIGAESLEIIIDDRNVQNASTIFEDDIEISSEVDEFWSVFRSDVLPGIRRGQPARMEVRLSEPPEIRAQIEQQARAEMIEMGSDAADTDVSVLMAHKQGFSWLYDVVRPELQGKEVDNITLRFAESGPPSEWPQQAMYGKIRWLKEVFPIDEVLARDLGIEVSQIDFEMMPVGSVPTYEVVASGPGDVELLRQTFEPKYVLRPYYDRFRDYEMVRVSTGWIHVTSGGEEVVDQRITTDYERFWDHYQAETLPAIYDYVMGLTADAATSESASGNPKTTDAPFFGELTVDLTLSEPEYRLEIDNEVISTMDSLHEEIYFPTLLYFRLIGRMTRGQDLEYLGRVIPIMRPKSDGQAGNAKISFTGFATSRPAVVVDYVEAGGQAGQERLDIPKVNMDKPRALGAVVRDGLPGLERLDLRVKVDSERDQREELLFRATSEDIDMTLLSAEQVAAMLENLALLRTAGMYVDSLAYNDLRTMQIAAGWTFEVNPDEQTITALEPNGSPTPHPDVNDLIPAGYEHDGGAMVQWDTPIPPPEGHEILAKMSTFEEATVYKVGKSYLGKETWAMDLMPPIEASHWSHAKATTFKPTVIYSSRQHANEVSSTSHVLKHAENLLTDPAERRKLDRVNVVIHPFTNPDGAQLAYDLYEITPDHILHAGYLGSLGMDATSGGNELSIYPESRIRGNLWSTWLPDIFLNPHGYPSHEVVQLFSEYAGLVRRGRVTERNWSFNKGWFIPGFNYVEDPNYPRHKDAAFTIRDYITEYMNSSRDVYDMNQRNYDRYRRYGVVFEPEVYRIDRIDDVNIYMPLKGSRPSGNNPRDARGYNPRVTIWSGGTEAPDETAYGEWMHIVAQAGLNWDRAILDYLFEGNHVVSRKGSSFWGGVQMSWDRPRPPMPEEGEGSSTSR